MSKHPSPAEEFFLHHDVPASDIPALLNKLPVCSVVLDWALALIAYDGRTLIMEGLNDFEPVRFADAIALVESCRRDRKLLADFKATDPFGRSVGRSMVEHALREMRRLGLDPPELPAEFPTMDSCERALDAIIKAATPKPTGKKPTSGSGKTREQADPRGMMILAELCRHHKCDGTAVENSEPIGVTELAGNLDGQVSKPTVSRWFKDKFGSHARYKKDCQTNRLLDGLKLLQGDYTPRILANAANADEVPQLDPEPELDD